MEQPRIYFGENSPAYSIVGGPADGPKRELDFPTDNGQENYTYTGSGGVPTGSPLNRLLFAVNKWLIAHKESGLEKDGAWIGLTGKNVSL